MAGPMEGVKVVEMAVWVAGPAASGMLCDWGADVVKIEPAEGDPMRGILSLLGGAVSINPIFELDNRGKRSVCLDLRSEEGRELALQIVEQADVFVSNYRPGALSRLGMDYACLRERNPRLVYCQVTGYGPDGEERDRAAYDVGAFWSRAGIASLLTAPGQEYPLQRGGMGDHNAAAQAAGAIAAALFRRERSGEGQMVAVSLARTGAYTIGWDLNMALRLGVPIEPAQRYAFPNPLILPYRCGDGHTLWLLMLQGDRHWPDFCRAIAHEEWMQDPRFLTIVDRAANADPLVRAIEAVMAERSAAEWSAIFDRENVWFAPVQTPAEVIADPVMAAAGAFVEVPLPDGPAQMVATPADFYGTPWQPRGPAPELGQHTEEVLLELGLDWNRLVTLKEAGVIP
ncbi:MAG TPA: CoA transferase [Dehalococcoidia bacterium]|nr:CoA transferase [Dehalococcoidia bacterium]